MTPFTNTKFMSSFPETQAVTLHIYTEMHIEHFILCCTQETLFILHVGCIYIVCGTHAAHFNSCVCSTHESMPYMCSIYAVYMPNMSSKISYICSIYAVYILSMCSKVADIYIQYICSIHA